MSKGPSKSGFNPRKEKFSQSYLRKEQAKTRRLVTRVLLWKLLKKGLKKSLVFRHRFGKILLNKMCVI